MCGICGVWEYGANQGTVEPSLLVRMRDEMTHRGPDDSGELVFDNRRGGFGFRRLSIIDLSPAGHQPMRGCDEQTWLVFNGEIYNHETLRAGDRKSTRLNSSHSQISYAVFCLKKKTNCTCSRMTIRSLVSCTSGPSCEATMCSS